MLGLTLQWLNHARIFNHQWQIMSTRMIIQSYHNHHLAKHYGCFPWLYRLATGYLMAALQMESSHGIETKPQPTITKRQNVAILYGWMPFPISICFYRTGAQERRYNRQRKRQESAVGCSWPLTPKIGKEPLPALIFFVNFLYSSLHRKILNFILLV